MNYHFKLNHQATRVHSPIKISKIHQRLSKHFIIFLEFAVALIHNLHKMHGIWPRNIISNGHLSKSYQSPSEGKWCLWHMVRSICRHIPVNQELPYCVLEFYSWVLRTRAGWGGRFQSVLVPHNSRGFGFINWDSAKGFIWKERKNSDKYIRTSAVIMLDFIHKQKSLLLHYAILIPG